MKKNPARKAAPTKKRKATAKPRSKKKALAFPDDDEVRDVVAIVCRAKLHIARLTADLYDLQRGDLDAIRGRQTDGPSTLADKVESLAARLTHMGVWDNATTTNVAKLGRHLVGSA